MKRSGLGQHGVNIMGFCKEFNEKTAKQAGYVIPVVITVYADRSFSFIMKTPPASISKRLSISRAAAARQQEKGGQDHKGAAKEIAETQKPD